MRNHELEILLEAARSIGVCLGETHVRVRWYLSAEIRKDGDRVE